MRKTAKVIRLNEARGRRGLKAGSAAEASVDDQSNLSAADVARDHSSVWHSAMSLHRNAPLSNPQLQSGALAYRRLQNGQIAVLLVSKSRSKDWGIPKGKVKAHFSFAQNAAKEAFEEAGVRGRIQERSAGSFRILKRMQDRKMVAEVWVYLLEVTETAKKWPEKSKRQVKWCTCQEAAYALREPLLVELCDQLAKLGTPKRAPDSN